jgi:alpha-L-fucosidase
MNFHAYLSREFANDWLARQAEIVEKYHPEIIYFDWWISNPALEDNLKRFAAFYYDESLKRGTVGVLNYKGESMGARCGVLDVERGQLSSTRDAAWQTDTSISQKSWGYIQNDSYKSSKVIVQQLVDIVSKNGNLLLNIGPRTDGTIPGEVQQVLRDIGGWLHVNGEGIYETRPWKTFGEGPTKVVEGAFHDTDIPSYTAEDFRFTEHGKNVYAIELEWPPGGEAVVRSLGLEQIESGARPTVQSVTLLGYPEKLHFDQRADGLHIELPSKAPGKFAYVFRIASEDG